MTNPDEKLSTIIMALHIAGLEVNEPTLSLFLKVKEVYDKKKDKMNLHDACKIKAEIIDKYGGQHHQISILIK